MRSKEEAMDYRYFPDPDLIPVQVDTAWVEKIRSTLSELPSQMRARFVKDFGLSAYDAEVLTGSKASALFFEQTVKLLEGAGVKAQASAKPVANWVTGELSRLVNEAGISMDQSKVTPKHLADMVKLVLEQTISSTGAKQVITAVWKTGESVDTVVDREGLKQVSDLSALDPIIDQVIAANTSQVAEYRAGKEKLIGFFVGQVMKASGGKANPALLQELIKKKLGS
jgi:aspartyl-tRNA(Asn)/glutamyl-tRNA(Gln) amidotransferase subunit B